MARNAPRSQPALPLQALCNTISEALKFRLLPLHLTVFDSVRIEDFQISNG